MQKASSIIFGILFITIGVLALLAVFTDFNLSWDFIWPIFVLGPGILFEISFFSGKEKDPGVLVPGGILLTVGIIMYVNVFSGWQVMEFLWPLFIAAPAVGLFQLYWFGKREKGLLIPVGILSVISLIFLTGNLSRVSFFRFLLPAGLILVGLYLLLKTFSDLSGSKK
ncbi:MAG TPA: hypothetical protein P5560_03230 [Thermotogota bacterium]|nr:hypothetical protein [Thermotogota bacterium]HRW91942.1 hypothetical protein [Thermotogota bacterium]